MSHSKFPPGWNEERVRKVLGHYEDQTEEEATAEDEAAFEDRDQTFMEVPNDLVPEIRALVAKHQARSESLRTSDTCSLLEPPHSAP